MDFPLETVAWRRSSRCDGGTCVEVADLDTEIGVRDAKRTDGPVLRFSRSSWTAFVAGVQAGDFDSPH